MRRQEPQSWGPSFLPRFRGLRWTWRRWALLAFAVVSFCDQFFIPTPRWDDSSGQGMLFLILGFRAVAAAEPPLVVLVAGGCQVALMTGISHGIVPEVSPVWTPIAFGLLIFILLTWRRGRKDTAPDSAPRPEST